MQNLYVCLFSNGHIKVGRTVDLWNRVRAHAGRLACTGSALTDVSAWECADSNAQGRERMLIELCAARAREQFQDEWFAGLDFFEVRSWAMRAAREPIPAAYTERAASEAPAHADAELIERIGTMKLARLLNTSAQRVSNWKTRGIPLRVRVDNPDLFRAA